MRTLKFFIVCSLLFLGFSSFGQKHVDLKLQLDKSEGSKSCFDIQLRSPNGHEINVAGQNYRIFYDANHLKFLRNEISHNLDEQVYSAIDLINTEDNDVGFISMSIDGRILSDKGIKLAKDGTWMNTLNICFEKEIGQKFDLTWANQRKTSLFATAEVAMSEWVTDKSQQILIPNELYDFSSFDLQSIETDGINISVFPNPVVDQVNVAFELPQSGQILIKDIIGRQIITDKLDEAFEVSYNLSGLPEGGYTVMVLNDKGALLDSKSVVKVVR